MKGLCKAIGAGIISLPFLLGGCKKEAPIEYVKLQGTVFSEKYIPSPPLKDLTGGDSVYSFSLDTEYGRKAIQVRDSTENKLKKALLTDTIILKESIDSMIEPGTKVEIEVEEDKANQQIYTVPANRIKVL